MVTPLVWLYRFTLPAGDEGLAICRGLRAQASTLRLYRAVEGDQVYAYLGPDAPALPAICLPPAARASRLECLLEVQGAAAGAEAPWHYVVETDVLPEVEDEFNAWYDEEHLPGLAAVPGTVRAMRLRDASGSPRYHACYDLAALETLGSPAWLAVRATPWSSRVRAAFRNTKRLMLRPVALPAPEGAVARAADAAPIDGRAARRACP